MSTTVLIKKIMLYYSHSTISTNCKKKLYLSHFCLKYHLSSCEKYCEIYCAYEAN